MSLRAGNQGLRILFFYASEIDVLGGAELSVRGLAEGLMHAGHHTAILEFSARQSKRFLANDLPVWSIPWTMDPRPRSPQSWIRFFRCLGQFQSVVREFRPDIMSVQFPSWQSPPVVAACAFPHTWRLVVTARGSDIRVIPFSQPRLQPWQRLLFKRADGVTAVSESLLRDLLGLYPFVRDKAQVIHNSLGPSWLETPLETHRVEQERYVLFVGFLHTIKGVDILLRAWQQLQERKSGIALWLVGDGPELNSLRTLSEELELRESVRFVGAKPQTELLSLFRNAALVVIPSRSEGLPRVALEAGACGSICVAANVGDLPEVIEDQVTGFLVEPESPEALAKAMLQAFDLPLEKQERMRTAARKKIESQFTQEKMIADYEALFKSLNGRQQD